MRILLLLTCLLAGFGSNAQQEANFESLKTIYRNTTDLRTRTETAIDISKEYREINIDSNAKYLAISKRLVAELKDKKLTARYHLQQGNRFKITGRFIEAIKSFELAIALAEEAEDTMLMAGCYNSLGLVYKLQGGRNGNVAYSQKALLYENRALEVYQSVKDTVKLLGIYSNLGIIHRDLKDFKKAEEAFLKGLSLAKEAGINTYNIGILNANLSQIYLDYYKNYDKAIALLNEAIRIYNMNGIRASLEHAYRNISYNYTGKKDYAKAIEYANKAIAIAEEVDDDHRRINAYESLSFAQKNAGLFEESLANYLHVKGLEDSLFSVENTNIIAEMDAKFETVKKDAQIKVLNTNAKLDKLQKMALSIGVILLLLIAAAIIFGMSQKRKREVGIAEKERIIEAEKLKNAHLELEFKQKVLTSKIVQLARKNEFLGSLETEVETLKLNVDDSVKKTSNKITTLIKRDSQDNELWEQFSSEFSSLNQGFFERLVDKHGSFSKSQIRLISLLKMNISSKDIADTLNITDEGIKKARYRLRKKLNLSSESDIQGYLLSFS
jgi:tetratricopeptide (TPR) repeat protein/DNA-binding CsgD family transcriptional regulator